MELVRARLKVSIQSNPTQTHDLQRDTAPFLRDAESGAPLPRNEASSSTQAKLIN